MIAYIVGNHAGMSSLVWDYEPFGWNPRKVRNFVAASPQRARRGVARSVCAAGHEFGMSAEDCFVIIPAPSTESQKAWNRLSS
jgi:hypothetical protein